MRSELNDEGETVEVAHYVRALLHTPGVIYYGLAKTTINEASATIPAFDPAKTYYIAIPAIQTLEEYFCQLKALLNIDYKYIMLPLDEPPFDINANTRTITVPAGFKSVSGLCVEGEQLAEMLFFRVDRFFDAMDLSSCDISVQWKLPGGREYITMVHMIDIISEAEAGKLIFACPLTAEITQMAGPVEFSVHFTKLGGSNSIAYRFNTLPAKASISAALKLENPDLVKESDISHLFDAAIDNSEMAVGIPAAKPVFTVPLGATYGSGDSATRQTGIIYLNQTSGDHANKLTVEATSSPAGTLTYSWYYTPYTGGVGSDITGNARTTLTLNPDNGSVAGTYQVKVLNRNGNKTSKSWSNVVTLPAPLPIELDEIPEHIVIEETAVDLICRDKKAQPNASYTYTWQHKAPNSADFTTKATHPNQDHEDTYGATEAGYYKVNVVAKTNGATTTASSKEFRVTDLPVAPTFKAEANSEKAFQLRVGSDADVLDLAPFITVPAVDNAFNSDEVIYRWFVDNDAENGVLKDFDTHPEKLIEITVEENKHNPNFNITSIQATLPIRCIVENWLNNKVARAESALYTIING